MAPIALNPDNLLAQSYRMKFLSSIISEPIKKSQLEILLDGICSTLYNTFLQQFPTNNCISQKFPTLTPHPPIPGDLKIETPALKDVYKTDSFFSKNTVLVRGYQVPVYRSVQQQQRKLLQQQIFNDFFFFSCLVVPFGDQTDTLGMLVLVLVILLPHVSQASFLMQKQNGNSKSACTCH